jgi:hypothetical protein
MNMQIVPAPDYTIWPAFHAAPNYLVPPRKFLDAATGIFTMGSCFAVELRTAFVKEGRTVYPDYAGVPFDPATQIYDRMPQRVHGLTFFDTFTIRQEFECAFGLWTDRAASFCPVRGREANRMLGCEEVWQDPTRKMVYAATRDSLEELTAGIDAAIREGIEKAEVIVLTLGLTEAWRHAVTGRHLCMPPGACFGGAEDLGVFVQSSIADNYINLRFVLGLLFAHYPEKQVVISVSPVHLHQTFAGVDVGTASTESKSILRALAGQISREYDNVTYFPAYEMAAFSKEPVFMPDGRHVTTQFAKRVVSSFIATFSRPA